MMRSPFFLDRMILLVPACTQTRLYFSTVAHSPAEHSLLNVQQGCEIILGGGLDLNHERTTLELMD
jgi:hypothetical protein